ncbi:MAG TPA: substrate-binding domain-containing protein, partial [Anaerolineae bacterium]|nr:substrate-binding domain-containing protein [Anaerolineae bacterium]
MQDKRWIWIIIAVVVIAAIVAVVLLTRPGEEPALEETPVAEATDTPVVEEKRTLGLSLSTLNNPFFVTLKEGAEAAAGAAGVELVVVDAQDDSAREATNIEDLIQKEVDLLLVNPTDADAIVPSIEKANEAGIPVFTIDRAAAGGDIVSHISSD